MPKRPNKKPPPDDPNEAAKAVVDRVAALDHYLFRRLH